jgi:hypothetical protein
MLARCGQCSMRSKRSRRRPGRAGGPADIKYHHRPARCGSTAPRRLKSRSAVSRSPLPRAFVVDRVRLPRQTVARRSPAQVSIPHAKRRCGGGSGAQPGAGDARRRAARQTCRLPAEPDSCPRDGRARLAARVERSHYPGWTATVDDKPSPVHQVVTCSRHRAPPGSHDVVLRFHGVVAAGAWFRGGRVSFWLPPSGRHRSRAGRRARDARMRLMLHKTLPTDSGGGVILTGTAYRMRW